MSHFTWNQSLSVERDHTQTRPLDAIVPAVWQYIMAAVVLSVFRLGGLTHQSLWFDEGYTLHLASAGSFAEFIRVFGSYTTSEHLQPLYYFTMYGGSRVAGVSDAALRFPSAIFSIGSGICLFALLRQLTHRSNRVYAAVGVGLFSISSYSVFYAQEARPYACIQFCSFLLILAWQCQTRQAFQTGKVKHGTAIFFAFASMLACVSSIFGALLFACLATADMYRLRKGPAEWWSHWRSGMFAAGVVSSVYALFAFRAFPTVVAKDIVGLKQPLWMNALYAAFGTMYGSSLGPSPADLHGPHKATVIVHALPVLALAGLAMGALMWGILRMAASSRSSVYATVGSITAALYAAVLFGGFGMVGKLNILPRHASALFAICIMAMCASVLSRRRQYSPNIKMILALSVMAVALLNMVSLIRSISAALCRKDDYRAVATELSQESRPIYLVGGQENLFRHYGLDVQSAVNVAPEDLDSFLKRASHSSHEMIVVMNSFRNYRWDGGPSLEAMLQRDYTCSPHGDFSYFQVLACTRRDERGDPMRARSHE